MSARPDWAANLAVTVYAHLCDDTTLWHRLGSESGRAALHIDGANSAEVVLFADRAGLARLQAAVGDVLAALDAQNATTNATDSADVSRGVSIPPAFCG